MSNSFIETIKRANDRNLCVSHWCTTCTCADFRQSLREIPDLKQALISLDVGELTRMDRWSPALRWAYITLPSPQDCEDVLWAWLAHFDNHVRFMDHLMFWVLDCGPFEGAAASACLEKSISLAIRTRDTSLIETLVWCLRARLAEFPALFDLAMSEGTRDDRIYNALAASGFVRSKDQIQRERRLSARATRNIFGAIRRNDLRAVAALLAKRPDLSATNADGETAGQYAKALGRRKIHEMIEQVMQALE